MDEKFKANYKWIGLFFYVVDQELIWWVPSLLYWVGLGLVFFFFFEKVMYGIKLRSVESDYGYLVFDLIFTVLNLCSYLFELFL